jgi:hypothetical protein
MGTHACGDAGRVRRPCASATLGVATAHGRGIDASESEYAIASRVVFGRIASAAQNHRTHSVVEKGGSHAP